MLDRHAPRAEDPADQKMPMTVGRVFLAAQHRDTELVRSSEDALEACLEERTLRQHVISNVVLLVVELIAIRSPAELLAEKDVSDAVSGEDFS